MSEMSSNNLLFSSHEINSLLKKNVYKQIQKSKSAIPSCSRYLARLIYKLRLLHYIVTTELFQKNGYDLNAYNNVRDILYNTDVITNLVKSIVHSPVGKLL